MQTRKYSYYSVKNCSAKIASEVIEYGESKGWGGSIDELDAIKSILNKLNIHYVDDMFGTWAYRDISK